MMNKLLRWTRFNWLYVRRPPWDTGISPPELTSFIQQHLPGRAIDLGCGTGTNLVTLAKAGWQVTGVDFVPKAVLQARRKLKKAGFRGDARLGDVARLETVQGAYDLVFDIGCYHGLAESARVEYRKNLDLILVPGGWYLLYAHWKVDETGHGVGITTADASGLEQILELERREDSLDRWNRKATWMLFHKGTNSK